MSRTLPAGLLAELQKRGRPLARVHLIDLERADGTRHYWSDSPGIFPAVLGSGTQTYKPWISAPPTIALTRSMQADAGGFSLQNLSGNLIDREVAALLEAGEFEGAYCAYRPWFVPLDVAGFEFHGFVTEQEVLPDQVRFRLVQLLQGNNVSAFDFWMTRQCHFRFNSAQCGYRRGDLFVALTIADIFSASTIGASGLAVVADLFKDEVAMILEGTGAGQERYISTHTPTTFTLKTNWTTNPDATSKFIITGPGTMKVSPQLADIFSSTTIGKTGLGRAVDEDKDELVAIIAGTGAGQRRKIASNTATTYTLAKAWTTTPDASSRFVVVFRICPKDRPSCNTRGVLERFPGIIHLQPQITSALAPTAAPPSGAGNTPPPLFDLGPKGIPRL